MIEKFLLVPICLLTNAPNLPVLEPELRASQGVHSQVVVSAGVKSLIDKAEAFAQSGELVMAMSCIKDALSADPNNIRAHFAKAYVDYNQGNLKATFADYNRIIALEPSNVCAFTHRGCLFYELGLGEQARQDFEKAVSLSPGADNEEARNAVALLQTIEQLPVANDYRGAFRAYSVLQEISIP